MKKFNCIQLHAVFIAACLSVCVSTFVRAQLPSYVPSNGLVAWYPFNGNANDESGNGFNGVVQGALLTEDRFGNPNSAYAFLNGNRITSSPVLPVGNAPRSVSVWFKTASLNYNPQTGLNVNVVLSYGSGPGTIGSGVSGQLEVDTQNGILFLNHYATSLTNGAFVSDNTWHNVIYTYDGSNHKLFLDGIQIDEDYYVLNTGLTQLMFGGRAAEPNWHNFNGLIDDAAIWNRALNAQEINSLFTQLAPCTVSNFLLEATITEGETYEFNGQSLTIAGTYEAVLTNAAGCDSVVTLNLSLIEPELYCIASASSASICLGQSSMLTCSSQGGSVNLNSSLPSSLQVGLVGAYVFNGNNLDVSGSNNQVSNEGPELTYDRFGVANSAYHFRPGNRMFKSTPNTSGEGFTYMIWHKRNNQTIEGQGVGESDNFSTSGGGFNVTFSTPAFTCQGVEVNVTNSTFTSDTAVWYHYAVTKSGNEFKLYINGVLNSQGISNFAQFNQNTWFQIGGGLADCDLDEVLIYNRPLESNEISLYYQISSVPNVTCTWSTGETTPTITVAPTETTTYSVTVTQGDQTCTSDVTITVNQPSATAIEATITEGETYDFNGQLLTTAGTYEAALTSAAGCDSTVTLTLSVEPVSLGCDISASQYSICPSESVELNIALSGNINSEPVLIDQFTMTFGGPFSRTVNTIVGESYLMTISGQWDSFCEFGGKIDAAYGRSANNPTWTPAVLCGSSNFCMVGWNGQPIRPTPDVYNPAHSYTYPNLVASQTAQTFVFTDNPYGDNCGALNYSIYSSGASISYLWSTGETTPTIAVAPTETTTYSVTVTQGNQTCTSDVTITVNQPSSSAIEATITEGETYDFNGQSLTAAGTYEAVLTNAAGCDSVVTLTLSVEASFVCDIEASELIVCEGEQVELSVNTTAENIGAACSSNQLPENLRNGLVAWYPFCGNANDASGNGNNGVVYGAALTTDRFGNASSAYSFDGFGQNDHIKVLNSASLQFSTTASFSVWYYDIPGNAMDGNGNYSPAFGRYTLFSKEGDGFGTPPGFFAKMIYAGETNNLGFFSTNGCCDAPNPGTFANQYSAQLANTASWKHAVFVVEPTQFKIYINGELRETRNHNSTFAASNNLNLYIGIFGSGSGNPFWYPMNGKIDDFAIYNRAISSAEVSQLYTANSIQLSWSTGATTPSITVAPTETTTYSVTVTQGDQICTSDVTITVNQPSATSIEATIAEGETYDFNGQSLTTAGTYEAVLTNAAGCDSVVTLTLSVEPTLTCEIDASALTVCAGEEVELTVNAAAQNIGSACSLNQLPENLRDGLVAWYPFCGNANDASGNGNDGVVNGAVLSEDRFGHSNSAYSFGESGLVENITTDFDGVLGSENRTISLWFLQDTTSSIDEFVLCGYGASVQANQFTPTTLDGRIGIDVNNIYRHYSSANVGSWNHAVYVYEGGSISDVKIYLNGVLQTIATLSYGNQDAILTTSIGTKFRINAAILSQMFLGKIDDVMFWNRAFSLDEVYQLYNYSSNGISWSTGETIPTINVAPTETTTYSVTVTQGDQTCTSDVTIEVLPNETYYADADGDGFGNFEMPLTTCGDIPAGYTLDNTDCNDGDALNYPFASCDDGDPCTIEDVIQSDCSCAGFFADSDEDGTCDAQDLCPGSQEPGTPCDDFDPCTINDVIIADCFCLGTFADFDGDGTCDANDLCAGPEAGTACDDNDVCTFNDVIQSDCTCAGIFADADNDGTCDANDFCAGPEAGTACDDNNVCTVNDIIQSDCSCAGTFADADNDGTCDANDNCAGEDEGLACDDNDPCTVNDVINQDCVCEGTAIEVGEPQVVSTSDDSICAGSVVTLSVEGYLGGNSTWKWYSGSCGETLVGMGSSIEVSPTSTTSYFVRAEGGACGNSDCLSTTVQVSTPPSIPQGIVLPARVCRNSSITISVLNPVEGMSYVWDLPNGWIITDGQGTATIQVLTNQNNGQIRVYASNECGISKRYLRSVSLLNCNGPGFNNGRLLQMELWPNPASEYVRFAHGDLVPQRMEIYDMMGRVLYDGSWMSEMDVSGLASGIYFVRATSGGESVVQRMEVAR